MAWRIEIDPAAERELAKLDRQVELRILKFLRDRVAVLDDPRSIGEALVGPKFGELWKYRVGDYRIVAHIEDDLVVILVVRVGHRREVYRR
jgi:mRNA interferase RelE/StbE